MRGRLAKPAANNTRAAFASSQTSLTANEWRLEVFKRLPTFIEFLAAFDGRRVFTTELKMTDSQALLAEYAKNGSEPAFRELVGRYVGLVYCTALRLVGGDTHLAEDVAQIV